MNTSLILPLIMRWAHILSAIVAVGGIIFTWAVLMPAARRTLSEPQEQALHTALIRRWQMFVHTAILLLIISGFYNYFFLTRHAHVGQPWYHIIFVAKVVLAFVVFGLLVALTSTKGWSARLRENAAGWTRTLALLAILVVLLSGVLKIMPWHRAEPKAFQGSVDIDKGKVSLQITAPEKTAD